MTADQLAWGLTFVFFAFIAFLLFKSRQERNNASRGGGSKSVDYYDINQH